ncbi:hypothetical protein RF11_01311 [Thelohanellus kitauei]|uniref:Uncharacterized protein n=1 Tax=Thelohanellus kitauei TaxID=669202 RepID=A0A0C2MFP8_THEKT|nr:hypothetical protein RF11_01311 [Thelohanellus kitauei]
MAVGGGHTITEGMSLTHLSIPLATEFCVKVDHPELSLSQLMLVLHDVHIRLNKQMKPHTFRLRHEILPQLSCTGPRWTTLRFPCNSYSYYPHELVNGNKWLNKMQTTAHGRILSRLKDQRLLVDKRPPWPPQMPSRIRVLEGHKRKERGSKTSPQGQVAAIATETEMPP